MQTHRNMLHTTMRDTNTVHFSPCDRLSLLRSTSTSGGTVDLFDGLLNGAAVYPYRILKEGFVHLSTWLAQEEITVFNSVSSSFRQFLGVVSDESLPHLRLIYVGGEPIHKHDVDLYRKHFSDECVLVVRLGCGEAGKVCQYMIDKHSDISGNDIPVGYPHEDLKLLILDDRGKQVDTGAVGEIAVRSHYLSPGYWRMPELTNAKFLLDPGGCHERTYLTACCLSTREFGKLLSFLKKTISISQCW
jgi:non-ribosomal peptide synthetase component F